MEGNVLASLIKSNWLPPRSAPAAGTLCTGRVVASLGSVSQLSPSPGDFSLISLVPPQVGKAARLSHLQENFVFNINLGGPGFEFVEGVSKHLDPET